LFFREPVAIELDVIGRERAFLERVAAQLDVADQHGEKDMSTELFAQLKSVRTNAGDHSQRFVSIVPNKSRVYAYNIARSAFVQNKQTNLTISDGQLGAMHLVKPSEAEGFSEIPLELSKKLLALPNSVLTYRKQLITGQGDLSAAKLNAFNAQESLHNAVATGGATEQQALVNSEAATLKAKAAEIDAQTSVINSGLTNQTTEENASIQAEIARLKAEAAKLDAETALLKARAARNAAAQPPSP
jgi:hypothetical protein